MYNGGELRWQQPNPGPGGSYLAYPILSSPQPPVSNDYAYYQIMPAPCPPVMGFYQPFPGTYAGPVQAGVVNPVSADVAERPLPLGPHYGMASPRMRGMVRPNVLSKVPLHGPLRPPTLPRKNVVSCINVSLSLASSAPATVGRVSASQGPPPSHQERGRAEGGVHFRAGRPDQDGHAGGRSAANR